MNTFKQYLADHVLTEGKKYKHPDAPTINNFVAKHSVNKSGAGAHTVKTKMKKKYAKRKDKHKGTTLYEVTARDQWLKAQGENSFDVYGLAQEIYDGSDGHDMEAFANEVLDTEEEVEDFLADADGHDSIELIVDYLHQEEITSREDYYGEE